MIQRKHSKDIMADSLKELMLTKELDEITIQDIVSNCHMNRSTFYRYFKDKYDLIHWIYKSNADLPRILYNDQYNWLQVSRKVLEFLKDNDYFFIKALNWTGQNSLFDYFFEHCCYGYEEVLIRKLGVSPLPDELKFAIRYTSYANAAMVREWAKGGMLTPPEIFAEQMHKCMSPTLYVALEEQEVLSRRQG